MKKKVAQIILGIVIIGLAYVLFEQIMTPLRFQEEVVVRQEAVVKQLKDIRAAQRLYKAEHEVYTPSFDTLFAFILNDSIIVEKTIGSLDDSAAVAEGRVIVEEVKIPVIDTVFGHRKFTAQMVEDLKIIPYSNGAMFLLDAGNFTTESEVVVPVFECRAPYKLFLSDLSKPDLINLIDDKNTFDKYPGIKVGAMDKAINDAGNWE